MICGNTRGREGHIVSVDGGQDLNRRWRHVAGLALLVATTSGCGTATIMENPITKQQINCTADAIRLAGSVPLNQGLAGTVPLTGSTGHEVPGYDPIPVSVNRFEFERQCVDDLKRDGFVCVSGC